MPLFEIELENGHKYQVDADDEQSASQAVQQQDAGESQTTAGGAVLRSAAMNILPALASIPGAAVGVAGGALTSPVTGPVGPIVGGAGGAMTAASVASALQHKILETIAPEFTKRLDEQMEQDRQQHWLAEKIGYLAAPAAGYKLAPKAALAGLRAIPAALRTGATEETKKLATDAAARLGMGVGTGAIVPMLPQSIGGGGRLPTLGDVGEMALQSVLYGEPRFRITAPRLPLSELEAQVRIQPSPPPEAEATPPKIEIPKGVEDAIQERSTAPVPLEPAPGDSEALGKGVPPPGETAQAQAEAPAPAPEGQPDVRVEPTVKTIEGMFDERVSEALTGEKMTEGVSNVRWVSEAVRLVGKTDLRERAKQIAEQQKATTGEALNAAARKVVQEKDPELFREMSVLTEEDITEPLPAAPAEPAAPATEKPATSAPAIPTFAEKAVPQLESKIQELHGLLIDSDAFANSDFYDKTFPIPRQGGIISAKNTQRYQADPAYAAKVDKSIKDITDLMVVANRQRLSLMDKPGTGAFGVDYSVGKARAGYTVNVVRAWHNEAKQKYPYTRRLGNISIREAFQNSLDAVMAAIQNKEIKQGAIKIDAASYNNTGFKVDDNGVGMSDADIGQKFLSLHSTGKAVEGRFGGFGIAKAVILGPADSGTWTLHTRDNRFTHELAQANEVVETAPRRQGTEIEVKTDEDIIDEDAKRYVETTELPKNVTVEYDGSPVTNPFKKLRPLKETVQLNDQTSYELSYYPNAPEGYNQKYLIRLVDEKTGAKLTQAIKDAGSDGFKGAVIVDITTKAVPGTEGYPLVDSRMEMKWGAEKPVNKLIEKHTVDPLSAKRAGQQFEFHNTTGRAEWSETIAKTKSDPSYKKLSDIIHSIWESTGKFFGTTPIRPFTPIDELRIKIDKGYKGYRGGTVFQAKHLAAYEAVSRLMAKDAGAQVSDFYGLLSKPIDGGSVNAEHAAGGVMGLNFINLDKTSLKNPYSYALYLRDLIAHELTHDFYGPHNEEFSSKEIEIQKQTAHLFPNILKISEAVLGKEIPREVVERTVEKTVKVPVEVKVEVPVEKKIFLDRYVTPEQQQFIYDTYEKLPAGKAKDDLYYPRPATPGQLEFGSSGANQRPAGFSGTSENIRTGGVPQQPRPPSPTVAQSGSVGIGGISPRQSEVTPPTEPLGPTQGAGPGTPSAAQGPDPGAPIEQLTDSFKTSKAPLGERIKALVEGSYNLGEKLAQVKDAVARALSGLKTTGDALRKTIMGFDSVDDMLNAKGELSAELEKRGWRVRAFVQTVKRAIPDLRRRNAIAKWVDAGGDAATLQQGLAATKPAYRQAYQDALNLTGDDLIHAQNIQNYFEARLQEAINAGVLEHGIADYLHRIYPKDSAFKQRAMAYVQSGILSAHPSLARKRVFHFDWEAEQAGLQPVQDFMPRIAEYETSLSRAIAAREFIAKLTQMKAPDGRPIIGIKGVGVPIEDPVTGERTGTVIKPLGDFKKASNPNDPLNYRGDYKDKEYPALSKWKWVASDAAGKPIFLKGDVAIHPSYAGRIEALLEPSHVRYGRYPRLGQALLGISSTFKNTMLDISGFHHVQIALHAMEHRVMPWQIMKDIPFENPHVEGLLRGGVTLGGEYRESHLSEGLMGGTLTRHIPVVGPILEAYHSYLFQSLIPRIKMTMALDALERNRTRFAKDLASGKMKESDLYHLTANEANAAFGEQNYIILERSKTAQDMLRLIFLAPDFLEARGRFAGQAMTKYGTEQRMALALGAVTMYTLARFINKALDDQYHFEPENLFNVIYKGNSYGLRTVQGDILHLIEKPVQFWTSRLNPVYGRTAMEMATGRDWFGRKRSFPEQAWDTVSNIVPIAIRSNRERSMWESSLNAFGVTARRYNDVDDAFKLAQKWKTAQGVQERGEFIYDPDKDPLRSLKIALVRQDEAGAMKEIQKLVQSKSTTMYKLNQYFQRYAAMPFTGSRTNDRKFIASLSEDERKTVESGRQTKQRILKLFRVARNQYLASMRAGNR